MKKLFNYICYIAIILVGIFNICYGIGYELKEYSFKKNASFVDARVYQEVKQANKKSVLYVVYYIKGYKYDGVLLSDKKTNNSTIRIYYDPKKPLTITDGTIKKEGYLVMSVGLLIFVLGISLLTRYIMMRDVIKNE